MKRHFRSLCTCIFHYYPVCVKDISYRHVGARFFFVRDVDVLNKGSFSFPCPFSFRPFSVQVLGVKDGYMVNVPSSF